VTRLSRYGAKLAEIDAAFHTAVRQPDGTYQINGVRIVTDALNLAYRDAIDCLNVEHIDAHMLGVLHWLDNGATLSNMGWRYA
jgi:hypothetical protein